MVACDGGVLVLFSRAAISLDQVADVGWVSINGQSIIQAPIPNSHIVVVGMRVATTCVIYVNLECRRLRLRPQVSKVRLVDLQLTGLSVEVFDPTEVAVVVACDVNKATVIRVLVHVVESCVGVAVAVEAAVSVLWGRDIQSGRLMARVTLVGLLPIEVPVKISCC